MIRRAFVGVFFALALILPTVLGQDANPAVARLKKDIFYLASDECEGRGPGTKGIELAADYIAKNFADAGLNPGGVKGTYFQPFDIKGSPILDKPNHVSFRGPQGQTIEFAIGKDFEVMGLSGKGKVTATLVFAGYGIQAKDLKYDDYAGLDVKGKVVVLLRHTPRWNAPDPFAGKQRDLWAGLEKKIATAESMKAAAVIVINDATELAAGDMIPSFSYLAPATSSRIPCVHVKRSVIDPVMGAVKDMTLKDVEAAIDRDLKPQSVVLDGWSATIETSVRRQQLPVKNVLGLVPGSGPLAKEYVVVGSHYDHLGYGGMGSLAPGSKAIHHGADDNGSGTTAMMELARRFAGRKDRTGRTLVFMAFSAEERGLLGSQFYCKEPIYSLSDTSVMVNLDMVGRLRPDPTTKKDKLIVQGTQTAKGFDDLVDKLNTPGFTFAKTPGGTGPSDHASFYQKKVPILFFWTGVHPDYHKPSDTADRINLDGMAKIVDYTESVIQKLVTEQDRPQYIEVKAPPQKMGAPKGPRLGIQPNYESDKEGVLIGGVSDGGAAAKGGLKAGDRIVEIAGRSVTNIETYMVIMSEQRTGQAIDVGLIRDGKKLNLKVTPQ
jgi:hypothetical protein